jgi:hypothetical protein
MEARTAGVILAALLGGCAKEIVIVECDAHDETDGSSDQGQDAGPGADAAFGPDAAPGADAPPLADAAPGADAAADGGPNPPDAGFPDGGPPSCNGAPYCFQLNASSAVANVGQTVALSVSTAPSGVTLSYRAQAVAQLASTRAMNRPALDPADVNLSFTVTATSGSGSFTAIDVAPWFFATTFTLRVYGKGPNPGDPEVYAETSVKVRGNTLFSDGMTDVFAISSAGRPALYNDPGDTEGRVIRTLVQHSQALHLAKDGTLLVWDEGISPQRILRFQVSGSDIQLGALDGNDGAMMPLLSSTQTPNWTIAEFPDGKFAVSHYDFSATPSSKVVLWNPDGSYLRTLNATDPNEEWSAAGADAAGDLLVMVASGATSQVRKLDPTTGAVRGVLVDTLPNSGFGLLTLPDGSAFVGGWGYILNLTPAGGRQLVAGLEGSSASQWRAFTLREAGIIATDDESHAALVTGRTYQGDLFMPNQSIDAHGVAYLE